MAAVILEMFRQYLRREADLDDLREWLALYQWDLSAEDEELADDADVALAQFDDGYITENFLRYRLQYALEARTITVVKLFFGASVSLTSARYSLPNQKSTTAATDLNPSVVAIAAPA